MPKPDLDNADSLNSVGDARRKGVYRDPIVGPDALDKMLRPAAPGAQFALSINGPYFDDAGFAENFAAPGWPEYRSAPA